MKKRSKLSKDAAAAVRYRPMQLAATRDFSTLRGSAPGRQAKGEGRVPGTVQRAICTGIQTRRCYTDGDGVDSSTAPLPATFLYFLTVGCLWVMI